MYSSTPLNVLMPALSLVMYVVTVDDAFGTLQYARWWLGDSSTRLLLRPSAAARRGVRGGHERRRARGGARRRARPSRKGALEPDAYAATAPQHASAPIAGEPGAASGNVAILQRCYTRRSEANALARALAVEQWRALRRIAGGRLPRHRDTTRRQRLERLNRAEVRLGVSDAAPDVGSFPDVAKSPGVCRTLNPKK